MNYLDFDPTINQQVPNADAQANATADFLAFDPTVIGPGGGEPAHVGESQQMGLLDYARLGMVDTPEGRIKVIADAMGVDPKYIGRERDRMMYYDPKTKTRHDITTDGLGQRAMEFAGGMIGKLPTIVGQMGGAAAGVPLGPAGIVGGGMAGAALGEGVRQAIGSTMEQKTPGGVASEIGLEVASELLPAGIAVAGKKMASSRLAHELQNGGKIDTARVNRLQGLENRFNIPLTQAERTGLPSMLIEQKRLVNKPGASDVLRPWLDDRGRKVFDAIESFADDFSRVDSIYDANRMTKDAVTDTVGKLKSARTESANPLYRKAFEEGGDVDVSGVIKMIEGDLPKLAGKQEQKAKDVLSMLQGKMRKGVGPDGKEVVEPFIPLEVVNNIKLELDDMIAGAQAGGNTNLVAKLTATKNALVDTADAATDTYKQARNAWKDYVDPKSGVKVSEVTDGLIGEVGGKQRWERESDAIRTIFGAGSSPETILKARLTVGAENPEAWNAMLKGYLLDNLRSIKAVSGEAVNPNIGGLFYKRTLGDPHQAAMLKAAMTPEQYEKFNAIGELLHLTSKAGGKESATHYMTAADNRARELAPKGLVVNAAKTAEVVNPLTWGDKTRSFISGLESDAVERFERALAEAMIRPDGLNKIRYLQVLSPNQERFRAAVTMFTDDMLSQAWDASTSSPRSMGIPLRDPSKWMEYDKSR